MKNKDDKLNLVLPLGSPKKIVVRSHNIPATFGVAERKRSERPELIVLTKSGKEKYPPVKVVPNKALKVKDILDRYTRGLPIEDMTGSKPVWPKEDMTHDSPDMESLRDLDRMDKADIARNMKQSAKFKKEEPKKPEPAAPETKPES